MNQPQAAKKSLDRSTAASIFGTVSVASIQRGVRSNTITKPRVLGLRRVGWLVCELDEWV